ncbi:hypothetical protein [Sphingomonas arenae]|uniref:hypothetical protein n=1 Tax=Sphingomonas arenae TaxID=2812555 RepID=UPI0019671037|nr:hypothetical protein [Sphingomonas arenae]
MDQGQSSQATGTRDETYDIIAVVYHALQGAENCQTYMQDASSRQELRQFFERACDMQRQLADEGKRLLHDQLMQGGSSGGGSAFSQFGSGGSAGMGSSQGMSSGGDQFGSSGGSMGGSQDMSSQGMGSTAGLGRDVGNDPQSEQFGQSPSGQGQRHTEMNTGGGGTSSF